jgi:translation initiation factor 2B subunit (eIF-2B alpha/beta/delta family)
MMEGQHLARTLADAGFAVEFGVDAAMPTFVRHASVVLVGADSLTDRGVVNKLGTTGLALVSRHAGLPCYVVADRQKWLPASAELPSLTESKPGEEVWPIPPVRVTVWNPYFECTPLELFSGIVGETGLMTPDELRRELHNLPIAHALRFGIKPPCAC